MSIIGYALELGESEHQRKDSTIHHVYQASVADGMLPRLVKTHSIVINPRLPLVVR